MTFDVPTPSPSPESYVRKKLEALLAHYQHIWEKPPNHDEKLASLKERLLRMRIAVDGLCLEVSANRVTFMFNTTIGDAEQFDDALITGSAQKVRGQVNPKTIRIVIDFD